MNLAMQKILPDWRAAKAIVLMLGLLFCQPTNAFDTAGRFMEETRDLAAIEGALGAEMPATPPPSVITGVTVPHHMLAADLIARGILAASSGSYSRVLIIAPDHFRVLDTPFGVTTSGFEPVTGSVKGDAALSAAILQAGKLFSDIGTAEGEHGVHSVLPFVHKVFPDAAVVAVTAASSSTIEDWREASTVLASLIGPETLVVQSTDYSHHLPRFRAVLRDQETLSVISSGEPEASRMLNQPSHLDSSAAQYIQMYLQKHVYGAKPLIVGNRNSADYVPGEGTTTSYVVTLFTTDAAAAGAIRYPDQTVVFFGGDTLLGRGITGLLQDQMSRSSIVEAIRSRTHGAPLVLNLEGVVLEERPAGSRATQLFMTERLSRPILAELGVTAASLANNHAWDFGAEGLERSKRVLRTAGVVPLLHGEVTDMGTFRLLPLTFKRSFFHDHPAIDNHKQLAAACSVEAEPPLIVFAHWGGNYTSSSGPFENEALSTFVDCGVGAVIGAHSHNASNEVEIAAGGALQSVFSLGNLLFDQRGGSVSSMMAELRVFQQGTIALRPVPMPNLYDGALGVLRTR
ncbi:MAG: AmmeMemoRadiSam system protein B [Rhizobiaceae bacterium]|nr:AmmeMemoRadiSam system protein B [Rhizobiaceae bacterium]